MFGVQNVPAEISHHKTVHSTSSREQSRTTLWNATHLVTLATR